MGIRKKIILGFVCVALLLTFSGAVSLIELSSLSRSSQQLLERATRTIEISNNMLDALQTQNSSLMSMMVRADRSDDAQYLRGRNDFEAALAEATVTVGDLQELKDIYDSRARYYDLINDYFSQRDGQVSAMLMNEYRDAYNTLTSEISSYMLSSQYSLSSQAGDLEDNAYRALTPGIIALGVCILIIIAFGYLIDLYFVKPVLRLEKGTREYLQYRQPFEVSVEGRDEVYRLREHIEDIIARSRQKKHD